VRRCTRYRVQQVRDRSQEVNRLCKILEDAGLKLTTVVSDVMGASGRAMLQALMNGTTDPAVLAELARGKLRKKLPELRRALQGRFARMPFSSTASCLSHRADLCEDRFSRRRPGAADRRNRSAARPFRTAADGAGHHSGGGPDWRDQHRG
jgi:hypothetical protein